MPDAASPEKPRPPFWRVLHWQILMALGLGVLFGAALRIGGVPEPTSFAGGVIDVASWLGSLVLRLLKMVVIPLTTISIIVGTARLGRGSKIEDAGGTRSPARLFGWTIGSFLVTSLAAAILGFVFATLAEPGAGSVEVEGIESAQGAEGASLYGVLLRIVPTNLFEALADGDILALIFVSVCLGLAIPRIDRKRGEALIETLDSLLDVVMVVTQAVLRVLPIGVFGLMVAMVATQGFDRFEQLGRYALVLIAGIAVHALVVLPLLGRLLGGREMRVPRASVGTAVLTAFSTSSSAATIPVTKAALTEKAGVSEETASFVVPLGATVNMDATAMHQCVVAVFLCQVLGIELTAAMSVTLVLVAVLASVGAAGIPSAGITLIFLVMQTLDVEGPEVDALVGLILVVDRPLDMLRTVGNVYSDTVVAAVVDRRSANSIS
ncbi:MAG: dicarboxylate/amino acid:cation symporter [Planctomycetota bacterium]